MANQSDPARPATSGARTIVLAATATVLLIVALAVLVPWWPVYRSTVGNIRTELVVAPGRDSAVRAAIAREFAARIEACAARAPALPHHRIAPAGPNPQFLWREEFVGRGSSRATIDVDLAANLVATRVKILIDERSSLLDLWRSRPARVSALGGVTDEVHSAVLAAAQAALAGAPAASP